MNRKIMNLMISDNNDLFMEEIKIINNNSYTKVSHQNKDILLKAVKILIALGWEKVDDIKISGLKKFQEMMKRDKKPSATVRVSEVTTISDMEYVTISHENVDLVVNQMIGYAALGWGRSRPLYKIEDTYIQEMIRWTYND